MTYSDLPGIRSTRLKKALESIGAYVADRPLAVSTAIALGSSVHAMVQHDTADPTACGILVHTYTPNSEKARALRQEHHGLALDADAYNHACRIFDALHDHPAASHLLWADDALREHVVQRDGFKAQIDVWHPDTQCVVDLKCTTSAGKFDRAVLDYGYDISLAHYERALGCEITGRWVVVDTCDPDMPLVDVYDAAEWLPIGRARWAECWRRIQIYEAQAAAKRGDPDAVVQYGRTDPRCCETLPVPGWVRREWER